jgi:phosphatidate cytidylyltransferase
MVKRFAFSDLRRRFFSTLAIFAIFSAMMFLGPLGLLFLSSILVGFLTYEWLTVCKIERRLIFLIIVPLIFYAMYNAYMGSLRLGMGLLLATASLGTFLSWFAWHRRFLWGSLALIYFGLPFTMLAWMLQTHDSGTAILLWTILVVSGSDIGGYLVGSLLRGPKMIPEISPNKTWTGFVGSLFSAILLGGLGYKVLAFHTPPLYMSVAAVVVGLVSIFGDLIESLIKRYHHVKDSGKWIPGHGGFLDRLDGYLFALPVVVWMMHVAPAMFGDFSPTLQEWWAHWSA